MKYHMLRSSRLRPTTINPITVPLEKATLKPWFKLLLAANAVLELARVATSIPMNPARAEKNPPVRKANGVNIVRYPNWLRMKSIVNMTTKKTPTPIYCLLRYACAPSLIANDISFIFSVPSSWRSIFAERYVAKSKAIKEPAGTIRKNDLLFMNSSSPVTKNL